MDAVDQTDATPGVVPEVDDLRAELQAVTRERDAAIGRTKRAERSAVRMRELCHQAGLPNADIDAYIQAAQRRPEWVRLADDPDDLPPLDTLVEVWLSADLARTRAALAVLTDCGKGRLRWYTPGSVPIPMGMVEGWRRHDPPPWAE